MRYLCRLITPPGGAVLDLFAGSGALAIEALTVAAQKLPIKTKMVASYDTAAAEGGA